MPLSWFIESAVGTVGSARAVWAVALVVLGLAAQFAGMRLLAPSSSRVLHQFPGTLPAWPGPEGRPNAPPEIPPLRLPIDGVGVPRNPTLLPGARRAYRGGVHQGVDFDCAPGLSVHAAIGGTVLWINAEPDIPLSMRSQVLERCRELERTPDDVLNVLHGKRVVVCTVLAKGALLTTSYSHLGRIRRELVPGSGVARGEVIAWTGKSGTSHEGQGGTWSELHFEARVDGVPLGVDLPPTEAGDLYRAVLGEGN